MINYKTISQDAVNASILDDVVSYLPLCVSGDYNAEIIVKGKLETHVQSLSDTVWCHLISSMLNGVDLATRSVATYSRNSLDRFVQVVTSDVYLSELLPVLLDKQVVTKQDEGYSISTCLLNYMAQRHIDMEAAAPMVNTPLLDVAPWVSETEGVHSDARMSLVSKSRGTQVSQLALDAVNKVQDTKFVISPVIESVCSEYVQLLNEERATVHQRITDQKLATEEIDRLETIIRNAKVTAALATKNVPFSFAVTMDWRGRMYYRSSTIQPQGSNFEKAALVFADHMPMSDEALEGLRVGVANELGKDKESWYDRIDYVTNGKGWDIVCEVATNPSIATISQYVPRDKAFLALTGCVELMRVIMEYCKGDGSWDGITSNYVIHQDGTCNGIQHASALLNDHATAFAVNCTASGKDEKPQDIYGMVAITAAQSLAHSPELADLLTRDVCKKPVMVTGYGASEATVNEAIAAKLSHLQETELTQVYNAVHYAIGVHAAAVVQMTEALNAQITEYLSSYNVPTLQWRTDDGMIIKQKYMDNGAMVALPSGFRVTLNKNKHLSHLDIDKMARAISPNFVHSLDAAHLRAVVRECDHQLVTIHDSIGSHPATFARTAKVIREEFVKIHSNQPLRTLSKWNGGVTLPNTGDYNVADALKSAYIFS